MRVAIIFENLGPYHQARIAAAARGLEVLAVEVAGRSSDYGWVAGPPAGFAACRLFEGFRRAVKPCDLAARLEEVLAGFHPDAVALPGWSCQHALLALRLCLRHGVPAIVMSESTEWDEPRKPWKEWIKRRVVGLFSAALVGGCPQAGYMARLGMPSERIFQGYDAVDNDYFARAAEEARSQSSEVSRPPGLPEHYFLASARFVEKKNLPRLLKAYARYLLLAKDHGPRATDRPWDLVLLGDGPLRATLNAQLSALNLNGGVHLPGFKQYPELPAYYGLARAFIHASTTEPWGLVVNEAMAAGLPVLVSNRCGCASELVQKGVNGFTFDPWDVEQLAELMYKLSTFNSQLSSMGRESQRRIGEWGPERFAAGLKAAAQMAVANGAKKATRSDGLLLRLLTHKAGRG